MSKWFYKNKAGSFLEYLSVVTLIIAALIVMSNYILRGFLGRWKAAGDTFGMTKQYDPRAFTDRGLSGSTGTIECFYDQVHCDIRQGTDSDDFDDDVCMICLDVE